MPDSISKREWIKKNKAIISISVMRTTEKDILDKLDSVDNRSGYIKNLIREDIKKQKT